MQRIDNCNENKAKFFDLKVSVTDEIQMTVKTFIWKFARGEITKGSDNPSPMKIQGELPKVLLKRSSVTTLVSYLLPPVLLAGIFYMA